MSPLISAAQAGVTAPATAPAKGMANGKAKHAVWLSPCETHEFACTSFWTGSRLNSSWSPAVAFEQWSKGTLDHYGEHYNNN